MTNTVADTVVTAYCSTSDLAKQGKPVLEIAAFREDFVHSRSSLPTNAGRLGSCCDRITYLMETVATDPFSCNQNFNKRDAPEPHSYPMQQQQPWSQALAIHRHHRITPLRSCHTMHLIRPVQTFRRSSVVSYWRLGSPITAGRWYNTFRAAPKLSPADADFDYVMKLVNPHLAEDQKSNAIDRLGREAMATEQIEHPNVIRLLDAELDRAPFFLVQPWIYGKSLDRLLAADTHVPLTRLMWIIRQIAEGIRAAHDRDRIYLGLEPSHVLLGKNSRTTLIGWSQSHMRGEQVWLPHDRLQPARYTAPECFVDGYRASELSDVYSLGALIYHAMSLTMPVQGSAIEQIAKAHQDEIPEDLVIAQPACPPALSSLVKQMLAKRPQQRPSFREVLNELIGIEIEHLSDQTLIRL